MKKQPFLDFVGEVMLNSPSGKQFYGRDRQATKVNLYDIQQFLHRENPRYSSEATFLLKHCKSESEREVVPLANTFHFRSRCSVSECRQTDCLSHQKASWTGINTDIRVEIEKESGDHRCRLLPGSTSVSTAVSLTSRILLVSSRSFSHADILICRRWKC